MAQLNATIDTGSQEERDHTGGDLIPNGTWLLFEIIESDVGKSTTDKGDWEGVKYTAKAVSGIPGNEGFFGRQVWGCVTTSHTGDYQAQAWGQQELGELGRALGIAAVTDSDQLLGRDPFWGRVGIKPSKDKRYSPKNIIREYRAYGDSRPRGKARAPAARQAVQQTATAQSRPDARAAAPKTDWRDTQRQAASGKPWPGAAA